MLKKTLVLLVLVVLATSAVAAANPVTIRWNTNHGIEDEPLFRRVIELFEARNPNIKVELINTPSGDDYYQRLTVMMASGTLPDVIYMRGGSGDAFYYHRGIAASIDEVVKRDADEINIDDFIQAQVPELQYRGQWMALPYDFSSMGIYYNKELFDDAGLAYPDNDWTWDELIDIGKKLTSRTPTGVVMRWGMANSPLNSHNFHFGALWTMGGELFNEDYTDTLIDTPETMEAYRYLANIVTEHKIAPGPGQLGGENPFYTGRAGMAIDGSWATMSARRMADFDFDVAMMPKSPTGHRQVAATGGSWAITSQSDHFDEAWEFVKFMTGPEASRIMIVEPVRSLPSRISLHDEWAGIISEGGLDPASAAIFGEQVVDYGRGTPPVYFDWGFVMQNKLPLMIDGDYDLDTVLLEAAEDLREKMREVGIQVGQ